MKETSISVKGKTFDIHRLSTHDGPGMRTTVFLKGCSLKCTWCHNPESIHAYVELQWISNKCIGCGECVKVCPQKALIQDSDGIHIDRNKCDRCMLCVGACMPGAMNQLGEERTVKDVFFDVIMQDKLFFENSGGGVTISGGEPLLQSDFVYELLKMVHEAGIHTAIDTSLQVDPSALLKVAPYVDLWLVDMKETDPDKQKKAFLGTTDDLIMSNFEMLLKILKERSYDAKIWVRTPLIPTATARENNVRAIGERLNTLNNGFITLWELCTFNNLCGDKYDKLNLKWSFDGTELLRSDEKDYFRDIANDIADGTYEVKVSGLTR